MKDERRLGLRYILKEDYLYTYTFVLLRRKITITRPEAGTVVKYLLPEGLHGTVTQRTWLLSHPNLVCSNGSTRIDAIKARPNALVYSCTFLYIMYIRTVAIYAPFKWYFWWKCQSKECVSSANCRCVITFIIWDISVLLCSVV